MTKTKIKNSLVLPRSKELQKFVRNPWAYYPLVDVVPQIRIAGRQVKGLLDGGELLVSSRQSLAERCITLLHELLHIEYPSWSEATVENAAVELYFRLTHKERLILALVLETEERERHRFFFSYEEERRIWQTERAEQVDEESKRTRARRHGAGTKSRH